jgi:hypothetical protein
LRIGSTATDSKKVRKNRCTTGEILAQASGWQRAQDNNLAEMTARMEVSITRFFSPEETTRLEKGLPRLGEWNSQMFVPFEARQLRRARVLWINRRRFLERSIDVFRADVRDRVTNWLLNESAYAMSEEGAGDGFTVGRYETYLWITSWADALDIRSGTYQGPHVSYVSFRVSSGNVGHMTSKAGCHRSRPPDESRRLSRAQGGHLLLCTLPGAAAS